MVAGALSFIPQGPLLAPTQSKTTAKPTVVSYIQLAADEQLPKAEHVITIPANTAKSTADTAVIAKKLEEIVQSSVKKLTDLSSRTEATVKFKYADSHECVARMLFERTTDPVTKKTALKRSATVYGYADSVPAIISTQLNAALAEKSSVPWGKIVGGAVGTAVVVGIITAAVVSNSDKQTPPGGTGSGSSHGAGSGAGRRRTPPGGTGDTTPNPLSNFTVSLGNRSPNLYKPAAISNIFRTDYLTISAKLKAGSAGDLTGIGQKLDTYLRAVDTFNTETADTEPLKSLVAEILALERELKVHDSKTTTQRKQEITPLLADKKAEYAKHIAPFLESNPSPVKAQYIITDHTNADGTPGDYKSEWLDSMTRTDGGKIQWVFTLPVGTMNVKVRLLDEKTGLAIESKEDKFLVKG